MNETDQAPALRGASLRAGRHMRWLAVATLLCVVILLRLNFGLARDLWEDEVIAAAHAEQPFWRLPIEVARFDVHPFLYFFQLHAWEVFGDSDIWLRLNSVFWNLLAIGSMFGVVRRLYGSQTAWIAASLFALSAPVVWMAQELRPYSWLYCLLIWAFFFVECVYGRGDHRRRYIFAAFGLCVGIIYTHAIGFFAVFLLGMYALGRVIEGGISRRAVFGWGLLFGACALIAVPPILVDLLRDANLGMATGVLDNLAHRIPRLLLPQGNALVAIGLASTVYLGVVVLGVAVRETRLITLVFLVAPIFLTSVLDAAQVHFFKMNVFSSFIIPFFIITLARLLVRLPAPQTRVCAVALGLIFTGFSVQFFLHRTPTTGFRAVTRLIEAETRPGDIVYVPQTSIFWGMARYMGTDRRAWQLQVAPALTDQWQRMYDRLGPGFVSLFDLEPQTQTLVTRGALPLLTGNESLGEAAKAKRVWLVTYRRADLPADFPPTSIGGLKPDPSQSIGFLQVRLYQ